jgi:RNA polymerase sigma-70 factor (ECF subfamily)
MEFARSRNDASETTNPLLTNDPAKWSHLMESVGPASLLVVIENRMSRALKQSTSAEDILQDSFLHAWRDRGQCEWRGVRAFRSWLLSVIDHRIQNAAARESAQKRGGGVRKRAISSLVSESMEGSGSAWAGPAISTTPSQIAMYRERASAMQEALAAMPSDLQAIVHMRLFEQLRLEDIAARMSIGVEAVRHRFRKGSELYRARLLAVFESRSRLAAPTVDGEGSPTPG